MKTITQELHQWIDLVEVIKEKRPKYARYLSQNIVIDAQSGKLAYTGKLEAIADILRWAVNKKTP